MTERDLQLRVIRDPFPGLERVAWVELRGPLNSRTVLRFQPAMHSLTASGYCWLFLDLSRATAVTSTGLGSLLVYADQVKLMGGSMTLTAVPAKLAVIFRFMRLDEQIAVVPA